MTRIKTLVYLKFQLVCGNIRVDTCIRSLGTLILRERELDHTRELYLQIGKRPNLLQLQLVILASHEPLRIRDIEEEHLEPTALQLFAQNLVEDGAIL